MNNQFHLRLGRLSDFDGLFDIYMEADTKKFLNLEIMSKEAFLPMFDELMRSGQLYVYECDHQIVATCIVMRQKRRASHVASLGTLATHSQWQRQGIGSKFMLALFEILKGDGIKRVDLCTEDDNVAAHDFYKKLGFKLEGVLKKYFKRPGEGRYIDEHLMALIF